MEKERILSKQYGSLERAQRDVDAGKTGMLHLPTKYSVLSPYYCFRLHLPIEPGIKHVVKYVTTFRQSLQITCVLFYVVTCCGY